MLNNWLRFSHWTCERCSPPICAVFGTNEGSRRMISLTEAEVSRSYLSQLEKGSYYASLKIPDKLATVLNVEPAELLKMPESRDQRSGN